MSTSAASMECRKVSLRDEFREDGIANIDIWTDGAWQRRSYASLNVLATIVAMETNQCLDFEVLSKHVGAAKQMKRKNHRTMR